MNASVLFSRTHVHIRVQLLNGCEADINGILIDTVKIVHLCHCDPFPFEIDIFAEEVFRGAWIKEVVFRFFDDIGGIDKKEEVAVAFLAEVEDQTCHDECLATASRHVEQKVERFPFTGEIIFKTEEKTCERLFLIWTERKDRVEVIREIGRNFGVLNSSLSEFL